jgi:hypothetical protein
VFRVDLANGMHKNALQATKTRNIMRVTRSRINAGSCSRRTGDRRRVEYQTDPSQYRHWKLRFDGPVATLAMDFDETPACAPATSSSSTATTWAWTSS